MPFVVEERGKDNDVPVRLLSRERLGFLNKDNVTPLRLLSRERLGFLNADCVIGNGQGNASPPKQRKKGKHD